MKLKVVDWIDYDDELPEGDNCWAARNAIIDDIRAHNYVFSGWAHQEGSCCAPVLNDGKIYRFSQRGWGDVMAEAHGYIDEMGYCLFAFPLDRSKEVRPPFHFFDDDLTPNTDLSEHFQKEVPREVFSLAQSECYIKLDDFDDLRYLGDNDTLTLTCEGEAATYIVTAVERKFLGNKKFVLEIRIALS